MSYTSGTSTPFVESTLNSPPSVTSVSSSPLQTNNYFPNSQQPLPQIEVPSSGTSSGRDSMDQVQPTMTNNLHLLSPSSTGNNTPNLSNTSAPTNLFATFHMSFTGGDMLEQLIRNLVSREGGLATSSWKVQNYSSVATTPASNTNPTSISARASASTNNNPGIIFNSPYPIFDSQQILILKRYLERNRNLVYLEILRRAVSIMEESQQPTTSHMILFKCVQLVKLHLKSYTPSVEMLIRLDKWCRHTLMQSNIKSSTLTSILIRDMQYIRNLISNIMEHSAEQLAEQELELWDAYVEEDSKLHHLQQQSSSGNNLRKSKEMIKTRIPHSPSLFTVNQAATAVTANSTSASTTTTNTDAFSLDWSLFIADFYKVKLEMYTKLFYSASETGSPSTVSKRNAIREQLTSLDQRSSIQLNYESRNRSILDSIYFGGQFRKVSKFEDKQPEIDINGLVLENVTKLNGHIETVKQTKQNNSEVSAATTKHHSHSSMNEIVYQLPRFSKNGAAFMDGPIAMTEEQLNQLFDTVIYGMDTIPEAEYISAVNQLILCLFDMYRHVHQTGQWRTLDQMSYFFMEMVKHGNSTSMLFKIIYNLHLLLQERGWSMFKEDLFERFCEMAQLLLFKNEKSELVWNDCHATYIALLLDQHSHFAKVSIQKLKKLDIRIVAKFLQLLKSSMRSEAMHSEMIAILANGLYERRERVLELNMDNLRLIPGGIQFILDHFVYSRSLQTRQTLFVILFDYLLQSMENRKRIKIDKIQEALLFYALHRADTSIYLIQLFKFVPDKFLEQFSKFVYVDLLLKQSCPILTHFKTEMDQFIVISFCFELRELAVQYLRLEREFMNQCFKMITNMHNEQLIQEGILILKNLLVSSDDSERKNGELMLFNLMKLMEDTGDSYLKRVLEMVWDELCASDYEPSKLIFLNVMEKLIYWKRSVVQTHGETESIKQCFRMLNENVLKFVSQKESHIRLLMKIFYVLMDFVSIYCLTDSLSQQQQIPQQQQQQESLIHSMNLGTYHLLQSKDNSIDLFLQGQVSIPFYLLKEINISILHHLFTFFSMAIPSVMEHSKSLTKNIENARVILLLFIIEKCKSSRSVLDSIGGITFFKTQLQDQNAAIAFFAAKYLMKQLSLTSPSQYLVYLNQLINKAQKENNSQLLENAYLQIHHVVSSAHSAQV